MFGLFKKKAPPVPAWRPAIVQPLDQLVARLHQYVQHKRDFALFTHGTSVLLPDGLNESEAQAFALDALAKVFQGPREMHPSPMIDGDVLVQYKHGVANLVLQQIAQQHWDEIEARHHDALCPKEVLHTQLGANRFDDFAKKALFGRCFMFMDAQAPAVVRIERRGG